MSKRKDNDMCVTPDSYIQLHERIDRLLDRVVESSEHVTRCMLKIDDRLRALEAKSGGLTFEPVFEEEVEVPGDKDTEWVNHVDSAYYTPLDSLDLGGCYCEVAGCCNGSFKGGAEDEEDPETLSEAHWGLKVDELLGCGGLLNYHTVEGDRLWLPEYICSECMQLLLERERREMYGMDDND